jgi:hypothetical protein
MFPHPEQQQQQQILTSVLPFFEIPPEESDYQYNFLYRHFKYMTVISSEKRKESEAEAGGSAVWAS